MSIDDIEFDDEFNETSELDETLDDDSQLSHVDDDATYVCDNCGEEIVIPVDLGGGQDQTYVEDCPVCCSPSVIHVHFDDDRVTVHAEPEQDRY
ncbi:MULTISPECIES: CPXCG motif-containing cysteine-rich protein [Pirellulaceae]|uniref:CPXCG motif-containing cysteine-rich protein n=1 Tax=Aporhodopirellula rubra TaxID=980271 RepID=A0A7W5H435_9BACT|nr:MULTISPECIES: CPXCG motif-containing cysteine-rich protein [Pirellulaceae]EMI42752.1 hypothetical protein RRSWK_04941 [Rhodopirellula sp. SWK7]MBB3204426.1 hypothetical protein [Aporhodopirellula rubra]